MRHETMQIITVTDALIKQAFWAHYSMISWGMKKIFVEKDWDAQKHPGRGSWASPAVS